MAPASNPPRRVLYVEDDRVAALLFTEALRGLAEYAIEVAETGDEALQLAATWRPDVLVLDAHLPDTSGLTLLNRLRALPGLSDTPAVLCSADALPDTAPPAAATAFAGFWQKPVQRDRLLADLAALSARHSR